MPRASKVPQVESRRKSVQEIANWVREEVRRRHGSDLTFEQRRDAEAALMAEVLWQVEEEDLQSLVSHDETLLINDRRYRRLGQPSSATYAGRWGSHHITEPLYREAGVHNGPTIKPLEVKVGMVSRHMTPDLARIAGELAARMTSREAVSIMKTVGLVPPSRAFLEKRTGEMAANMADCVVELEAAARLAEKLPPETASLSCGMDRMAVRMAEPLEDGVPLPPPKRTKPYQRTPPLPQQYMWRMAWVGTTTAYDSEGTPLQTWRYATDAGAPPSEIAERVTADVAWIGQQRPGITVQCIQDAAPELRVLPGLIRRRVPDARVNDLVDFEHLMGYLDDVVDACEPKGDPSERKRHYRQMLLTDDNAIDDIWRRLKTLAGTLVRSALKQRRAVAAALSYIRRRKRRMRYASFRAAGLAVGSGVTENLCVLMQDRVKQRGQSWHEEGLAGIMTLRGLVLSGGTRWQETWSIYASSHRMEVQCATN